MAGFVKQMFRTKCLFEVGDRLYLSRVDWAKFFRGSVAGKKQHLHLIETRLPL